MARDSERSAVEATDMVLTPCATDSEGDSITPSKDVRAHAGSLSSGLRAGGGPLRVEISVQS
jgi:hypothetical protein